MFDVDNKRAVDRLAAVVVMLERREATARAAYVELEKRITADEMAAVPAMSAAGHNTAVQELHARQARWTEAQQALATVRELTRDL